jgi:hypothetical protein
LHDVLQVKRLAQSRDNFGVVLFLHSIHCSLLRDY